MKFKPKLLLQKAVALLTTTVATISILSTTSLAAGGTVDGNIIAFTAPATEVAYHFDRQLVVNKH